MHLSPNYGPKRKHTSDSETRDVPTSKRLRVAADQAPATSHYLIPYEPILAKLRPKYELKTMSVMPSTNIGKHVDKALEHLGRFSAWDQSVLPGIVFFSAKFTASNKLITISELVRRRIGESEQKWYQYNVLGEIEHEEKDLEELPSVDDPGPDPGRDEDDYFESMKPTIHDRAVEPVKARHTSYMSTVFSRVPLDELKNIADILVQTNEESIELLRRKKMGAAR